MQVKKAGERCTGRTRSGEESHGLGDQRGAGRVRPKAYRRGSTRLFYGCCMQQFGFGAQRPELITTPSTTVSKELVSRYEMEDQDDILALHSDAEENRRRCGGVAQGE